MIIPIEIRPKARVKNKPSFGKLVLKSARANIKRPTTPVTRAIFCLVEISKASGFANFIRFVVGYCMLIEYRFRILNKILDQNWLLRDD